jgi:hypothetical protein
MAHRDPHPRTGRGRRTVPGGAGTGQGHLEPFYVTPEEAQGIDALAEQVEMSPSELVTLAIDFW